MWVWLCVFFSVCAKYVRNFTHICTLLQNTRMYIPCHTCRGRSREQGLLAGHIRCIYDATLIFMACPLVIWTSISMGRRQQQEPNLLRFIFHFSVPLWWLPLLVISHALCSSLIIFQFGFSLRSVGTINLSWLFAQCAPACQSVLSRILKHSSITDSAGGR